MSFPRLIDLWNLLDEGEEKDTARLTVEQGEVLFDTGRKAALWTARLEYLHNEDEVTAGGFGGAVEEALADLIRVVAIGKEHERNHPVGSVALAAETSNRRMKNDKEGDDLVQKLLNEPIGDPF